MMSWNGQFGAEADLTTLLFVIWVCHVVRGSRIARVAKTLVVVVALRAGHRIIQRRFSRAACRLTSACSRCSFLQDWRSASTWVGGSSELFREGGSLFAMPLIGYIVSFQPRPPQLRSSGRTFEMKRKA